MIHWQYQQIFVPVSNLQPGTFPPLSPVADQLGADGWECCGFLPWVAVEGPPPVLDSNGRLVTPNGVGHQQTPGMLMLFKRPVPAPGSPADSPPLVLTVGGHTVEG